MDLTPFKILVKKKTGLTIGDEDSERIGNEIQKILTEKRLSSSADYFDLLTRDETEFLTFLNLLTINETYFFREHSHFTLLTQHIIPNLLKKKSVIKILSAGCSTGEEPYTVVMALMEKYGDGVLNRQFPVIGVDIDTDAIEKAKNGIYHEYSFRSLNPDLKHRYFDKIKEGWQITKTIRDLVTFQCLNLLSTPYPNTLIGMDVIFYRNVAIYFESETQQKIFKNLSNILNENGYLIVSSTETLSHDRNILRLIEIDGIFLFQKLTALPDVGDYPLADDIHPEVRRPIVEKKWKPESKGWKAEDRGHKSEDARQRTEGVKQQTEQKRKSDEVVSHSSDALYQKALALAENKSYADALSVLDGLFKTEPVHVKGGILKAGILINLQQNEEAQKLCEKAVQYDPLCAEGYLLAGVIAKTKNNIDDAVQQFKKAVYLNPSSWLAHFYLAELLFFKNEKDHARREYGIVIKLLENGKFSEHGLTLFSFPFSEKQIIHLCRKRAEFKENIME